MLHLAHQVCAHVSRFGEDAAAHAHEERQKGAAKTKAQEGIRRRHAKNHEDDGAAEESQAIGQHASDGAGAVGNAQRAAKALARFGGHAHIGVDRHAHANLADCQAEARAHDEGDGATEADQQLQ